MGLMYAVVSNLGNFSKPMSKQEARSYARTLTMLGNNVDVMKLSDAMKYQEILECDKIV